MANEIKPSVILKRLFHKAKEMKGNEKLTLKKFVRKLADEGEPLAKAWFFNKSLQANKEAKELRIMNKGTRIALEKNATKMARRKKSQGKGGGKAATTVATPAKV